MNPVRGGRSVRGVWAVAVALTATACGQWSAAPVTSEAPAVLLPLGPGTIVTVSDARAERAALAAWGRTVALAWTSSASQAASRLSVATSHDAAASFAPPIDLSVVVDAGALVALDVAVSAPERAATASGDPVQVWVRLQRSGGAGQAWRSRDAGRRFEPVPVAELPSGTFDEAWSAAVEADVVTVDPPGALRAAGPRRVTPPGHALPGRPPAAVLDEHGALALAWPERGEEGLSIVLRRAWVDWNGASRDARPFDAPFIIARGLTDAPSPLLAAVPGGVIVAWSSTGEGRAAGLHARRVGLDMTCTSEQAGNPAHQPSR